MKHLVLLSLLFLSGGVGESLNSMKLPYAISRLRTKAAIAQQYCEDNKLNTDFCLLFDAKLHSGRNRLFIWDFKKDSVIDLGLCAHGCCNGPWGEDDTKDAPVFSNKDGSHCSSLGKYKIGSRGYSNWGIHINYKMHGLEPSNSNAFRRTIVLHSWDDVPDLEVYPRGTPEGWGCPALSNTFMRRVDDKLKTAKTPVLFWIFN